ncbi:MAG: hypothetical protein DSZ28_05615 [Thiothrix sp.]|nr:MAG: hypothetical protein DSZ28_05615 [Thiothrix sp.]
MTTNNVGTQAPKTQLFNNRSFKAEKYVSTSSGQSLKESQLSDMPAPPHVPSLLWDLSTPQEKAELLQLQQEVPLKEEQKTTRIADLADYEPKDGDSFLAKDNRSSTSNISEAIFDTSNISEAIGEVIGKVIEDRQDPGIDPGLSQEQQQSGGYGHQQVQAPLYAESTETLTIPGFVEDMEIVTEQEIDYQDVAQGSMGDCYFLASVAALAKSNPELIRNLITDNGDGTYTVHFTSGDVTVDGDFLASNGSITGAGIDPDGRHSPELWVAILEKAYAKLKGGYGPLGGEESDGQGGFVDKGGHSSDALYELTGEKFNYTSNSNLTPEVMQSFLDQGKPVTASSYRYNEDESNAADHPGIVGNHVYSVLSVDAENGLITLYNPWGHGEPLDESGNALDGSNDGVFTMTWEEYQEHFVGATMPE